jgi:two-component system OmpR family response regulator
MSAPSLERVLYVDDEADIQQVVAMSLELDSGFDVRTCGSGADAIVIARAFRPHLILLDVMMPDMDGPTTLSRLRADRDLAEMPVIFLTAKAQRTEVERLRALGAIDVIAKPFNPMTLAAKVREIWTAHHA